MKIVLDTHVYLWLLSQPSKVSKKARTLIASSDVYTYVSIVSIIEIAIKSKSGKLEFDFDLVDRSLNDLSASMLSFTLEHAKRLAQLEIIHRDPFDRMLVAQAQCEQATIITSDDYIRSYAIMSIW